MMYSWQDLVDSLLNAPAGSLVRVPVALIVHPISAGMRQTVGFPVGQKATFSIPLSEDLSLHVDDFGQHYDVRLSRYVAPVAAGIEQPARTPVTSLRQYGERALASAGRPPRLASGGGVEQAIKDAPGSTLLVTTALGAFFGALGGSKESTMTGALLGGVAGLAAVSMATEEDPGKKAQMGAELAQMMAKLLAKDERPSPARAAALGTRGREITDKLLPAATEHPPFLEPTKVRKGSQAKKGEGGSARAGASRRKRT